MIRSSINLPFGRRLDLNLVKVRGGNGTESLLPKFETLKKVRKGNKLSRLFSHVFEKKRLRKIFGKNLLFVMLATSFVPQTLYAYNPDFEIEPSFVEAPVVVNTKQGTVYPVQTIKITQNYGFLHPGIDFDGLTGDPINPISAGKVEKIEHSKVAYGNAVYINHGNGTKSLYAHLSKVNVTEGEIVSIDTVLGEMGATGRAFGDHLHLEVYEDGRRVNPLSILK